MSRISGIEEGNKELLEQLKKTSVIRQRHLELKEIKEENKILFRDLSSIPDPQFRAYIQAEQAKIMQKRLEQQQSHAPPPTSDSYSQYFTVLVVSYTNLPEY